jgi:septum formation protein
MSVILASSSPTRRRILQQAGVVFEPVAPTIDERAAEAPLVSSGMVAADVAMALAMVKAVHVSEEVDEALVIGADQTLELDGERLTKPGNMETARRQLLKLRGRTHELHSAVCCTRGGQVLWQYGASARLRMRAFSPAFVGRYLADVGRTALGSVGAYQVEGRGIQLFEEIEGDFFAILGLPLLPLLAFLREQGELES